MSSAKLNDEEMKEASAFSLHNIEVVKSLAFVIYREFRNRPSWANVATSTLFPNFEFGLSPPHASIKILVDKQCRESVIEDMVSFMQEQAYKLASDSFTNAPTIVETDYGEGNALKFVEITLSWHNNIVKN